MELENIHKHIEKDLEIDILKIDHESARTNKLFSKYIKIYTKAITRLGEYQQKTDEIRHERSLYYLGKASDSYYQEHGYINHKIVKSDLTYYLKSDKVMVASKSLLRKQEIVVDLLERTLKQIQNRNFEIKNIIEWKKLHGGGV